MTPSIIVRFDFNAAQPVFWQALTFETDSHHYQADLAGFHDWLQAQKDQWNLYLLLPNEQFSFHHLEVPAAVKRSAQQLAPVLMEEQLAEDIDRVQLQYVANNTEDQTHPEVNIAACNKQWFEQLVACFKTDKTRLKACLPESICPELPVIRTTSDRLLAELPTLPRHAQLPIPAKFQLAQPDTQQFLNALKQSPWNLVSPETSGSNPLHFLLLMVLVSAGLYLLNLG